MGSTGNVCWSEDRRDGLWETPSATVLRSHETTGEPPSNVQEDSHQDSLIIFLSAIDLHTLSRLCTGLTIE